MLTYQYKLYNNKSLPKLEAMISSAAFVWNHCLTMQKKYYGLYNKFIPCAKLQSHFAKKVKKRYSFLNNLNSQTIQEVIQRLDSAYQRFFKKLSKRPPKFKRGSDFTSIVFKQCGYTLNENILTINSLKKRFPFFYSRPYEGRVINIRLKRTHNGYVYLYIVTDASPKPYGKTRNGASIGMDFGLKTYLTLSDGSYVENPQFLKKERDSVRKANKSLSRKVKGSNNRKKVKQKLSKLHERIVNKRNDFQWKLAHELCKRYDNIFIEDLNLRSMQRLWGRKVSDLSFASFIEKLEQVSNKYGVIVHKIDRWYASSRTCGNCGYKNEGLSLKDREWVCPHCGQQHDRDVNAAKNILRQGIAELESCGKTALAANNVCTQESHVL